MQTIDNGELVICLQALERAIEHNEFLSQSETVDKDDYEEINYRYELTLNKLAKKYIDESKKNPTLIPIDKIIKYKVVE
ncbi:hypothetical protein [Vibrio nigripulchritudo]|uniref:hypothetical protein n=1 Tax=Vibrio nigripulchritudo TaxID=28173 RepID=UPI0003B1F25A|nr:hypothetical protein [Vibrio nigripulchritudo]BDU39767.1 hypothetical protein TUMSATVNIG2_42360 [Vibrio nigripulchritudo]BDU45490.1 hypothetical protein TUMSATVNIG3_42880 [Vibrio nigripulchritudo]CCN70540.1 hypothetical protein VIBNISFn118_2240002 [Vibrio nigripulchritudo SFn118]